MRIPEFGHLYRGQHSERFTIEHADRSEIVADPQLLSIGGKDDVIGLTETIRARELLANDGHGGRIDGRECRALLSVATLAFVGNIGDLFVRRKPDAIGTAACRCDTLDSALLQIQLY